MSLRGLVSLGLGMAVSTASAAEPVRLFAAGSLRAPLTEIAGMFEARAGGTVSVRFGPSGLLRDEIAQDGGSGLFASANMEHPRALAEAHKAGPVVLFARNRLCVLARPSLAVGTEDIVGTMLNPGVKLGTSTPGADPSGDYAWELFRRIDAERPGSYAVLDGKALKLTGGPSSTATPAGRNPYGAHIASGRADLFVTYCTNALEAAVEITGAAVVSLPPSLAVGADYGLTVFGRDPTGLAHRLALFLLSTNAQATLARHGFAAPNVPATSRP